MTCHNDSAPQGGPYRVLTLTVSADRKMSAARSVSLSGRNCLMASQLAPAPILV